MWESYVKQVPTGWNAYIVDGNVQERVCPAGYSVFMTKFFAKRRARLAANRANIRDYSQMEKV